MINLNDCWIYLGAIVGKGYGMYGHKLAHRLSYEAHIGIIPIGLQVDHLCRNRRCINPEHLELVNRKENILRGISPSAIHARKVCCPKGHPYSYRKPNGSRQCRVCMRNSYQRYWKNNRKRINKEAREKYRVLKEKL